MASSGWASNAIFLALLSLSMINSAESRLKIPPIFPPKMFVTPSQEVSRGVHVHPVSKAGAHLEPVTPSPIIPENNALVHPVPQATSEVDMPENNARVHPVPRAATSGINMISPIIMPDNNARVHPVPRAASEVDMPENNARVHPVPRAATSGINMISPIIMPDNNARVHPVPRAASTGVSLSPPPKITYNKAHVVPPAAGGGDMRYLVQTKDGVYKTFAPTMGNRAMAMAPTKI